MDKMSNGLRKRQQITRANQTMFLWVAGVSVIIGFSVVIALFIGQKIIYSQKVIQKKEQTEKHLVANLKNIDDLKGKIRVLDTDEGLKSTRLSENDSAIQSILDALTADANVTALGSSLEKKILDVPGVTVESITPGQLSEGDSSGDATPQTLPVCFSVSVASSNTDALREVLLRLEKSIRAINVTNLSLETQGTKRFLTVTAEVYYQSPVSVEQKKEVVK